MKNNTTDISSAVQAIVHLPLAKLHPSANNRPHQSGLSQESINELAASIRAQGIIQPLIVKPTSDGWEIVAGERRWRAARVAKIDLVPCIVREISEVQAAEVRAIENVQREGLHPIEEANGYAELLGLEDMNCKALHSVQSLAVKLGISEATIYGRLKLLQLPRVAIKASVEGKLVPSNALLIARIPDERLRVRATLEILQGKYHRLHGDKIDIVAEEIAALDPENDPMSYRDAKNHIQDYYMVRLKGCPFDQKDAELVPVQLDERTGERIAGGACTDCPLRTGNQITQEAVTHSGGADVCTNPACFANKKQVRFKLDAAKAKADGQKLLPEKQAEKLFCEGKLGYTAATRYVDLQSTFPGEKKKRWDDVLPETIEGTIVQDPEAAQESAAARALKGVRANKIAEALASEVMRKVSLAPVEDVMRFVAEEIRPGYHYEASDIFIGAADRKTLPKQMAHIVACCGFGQMTDYDGSIDETLIATCSRFGVDHKAIIKQRQAEYKAEDKAAKALVKKAKL